MEENKIVNPIELFSGSEYLLFSPEVGNWGMGAEITLLSAINENTENISSWFEESYSELSSIRQILSEIQTSGGIYSKENETNIWGTLSNIADIANVLAVFGPPLKSYLVSKSGNMSNLVNGASEWITGFGKSMAGNVSNIADDALVWITVFGKSITGQLITETAKVKVFFGGLLSLIKGLLKRAVLGTIGVVALLLTLSGDSATMPPIDQKEAADWGAEKEGELFNYFLKEKKKIYPASDMAGYFQWIGQKKGQIYQEEQMKLSGLIPQYQLDQNQSTYNSFILQQYPWLKQEKTYLPEDKTRAFTPELETPSYPYPINSTITVYNEFKMQENWEERINEVSNQVVESIIKKLIEDREKCAMGTW